MTLRNLINHHGRALLALILATCLVGTTVAQNTIEDPPSDFRVRLLGENEDPVPRQGPLKILGADHFPALKKEIEQLSWQARATLRETTLIDWEGTAYIVFTDSSADYRAMTGKRPEYTSAAANAAKYTVWINGGAWRKTGPGERLEILTHEFGHLLIGNITEGRRIPLWAEEGLVQHLAGEWGVSKATTLYRGHALGTLPPLAELERSFPEDPLRQALAYAIAFKAVQVVAGAYGDKPGKVERLVRRLADNEAGPVLIEALWSRTRRDDWNRVLLEALGDRYSTLVILLTSGTTVWFLIMILFAFAWRTRKKRRALRESMERQREEWAESLTDEDIQDIYGDREERFDEVGETPWERHLREKEETEERWM